MICTTCINRHWIILPSPAIFTILTCTKRKLSFGIASDVAHGKGDKQNGIDAIPVKCIHYAN